MAKKKGFKAMLDRQLNPLSKQTGVLGKLNALSNDAMLTILGAGMLPFKDGGRVRGCGKAKRGFGKAMKRKK
jgi:hypothetical protein